MALIPCPACGTEVSDQAQACPKCAHPIAVSRTFRGPPIDCSKCGGGLRKEASAKSEGSGCLIVLVGLVLAPILIGIPIVIYGIHLMSKKEGTWRCRKCQATFPRKIQWYEFG
jgi:ribosomal protein L37AE/L43A